VTWSEVKRSELNWSDVTWYDVKWSEVKWSEVKWSEVKWSEVKWSEVKWSEVKWSVRNEFTILLLVVQLITSLYRSSSTGVSRIPSGHSAVENDLCLCRQLFTDMRDLERVRESFHCLRYPDSVSKLFCTVLHYMLKIERLRISCLTIKGRESKRFGREQQQETSKIVPVSLNTTLDVLFWWSTSPSLFLEIKS
jgi:hypothetical protein